jgi:hypothetical protein
MTTYAIALTALLSGIIGYMIAHIQEEVFDAIQRRKKTDKGMSEPEQMDQAVHLVREKLGGTEILTTEHKVN